MGKTNIRMEEYLSVATELELALVNSDALAVLTLAMRQQELVQGALADPSIDPAEMAEIAKIVRHQMVLLSQVTSALGHSLQLVTPDLQNVRSWV